MNINDRSLLEGAHPTLVPPPFLLHLSIHLRDKRFTAPFYFSFFFSPAMFGVRSHMEREAWNVLASLSPRVFTLTVHISLSIVLYVQLFQIHLTHSLSHHSHTHRRSTFSPVFVLKVHVLTKMLKHTLWFPSSRFPQTWAYILAVGNQNTHCTPARELTRMDRCDVSSVTITLIIYHALLFIVTIFHCTVGFGQAFTWWHFR